jgi:putative transposase
MDLTNVAVKPHKNLIWLEYFGFKYGKVTIAVPLHNTSQNCSSCGKKVRKSLSTRTHVYQLCGFVEDRDVNAAINILKLALSTVGHTGTYAWGDLPNKSDWSNPVV